MSRTPRLPLRSSPPSISHSFAGAGWAMKSCSIAPCGAPWLHHKEGLALTYCWNAVGWVYSVLSTNSPPNECPQSDCCCVSTRARRSTSGLIRFWMTSRNALAPPPLDWGVPFSSSAVSTHAV